MKKYLLFVFIFAFVLPVYSQDSVNSNIKELTILHWNDFHARNMPYKISKKDSLGNPIPDYYIGGTSGMLGYINKFRDEKSLILNGGDDYQGTPISSITRGFSQIKLLNLFSLDAFVIGNHDFDYGQFALDSALNSANFNFLSANIYDKTKKNTFASSFIIKDINGIKIGIIGLSPNDLMTLTLPKNVAQLSMLNCDSVITADIGVLKKFKCNLIILLSHNGVDNDREFAKKFYGDVDIIIGGHSHTPTFKPEIVNGVYICQAGSYGRWLGKLDVKVDIEKDTVVKAFGKLYETKWDSTVYDRHAQEIVENMISSIEPAMKKSIGKLLTDWKKNNLGQWETDAIREKTKTDISFLNTGSIRKDLLKGDITVGDVWEINPFGNTIMKFSVTGKTLTKMLANSLRKQHKNDNGNDYDGALISGLYIEFDSKLITDMNDDFIKKFLVNGKPLDINKNYSISTNSYTVSQIKKYFGEFEQEIKADDTNIIDRDLIIEAVQKQKEINSVFEKRIVDISK